MQRHVLLGCLLFGLSPAACGRAEPNSSPPEAVSAAPQAAPLALAASVAPASTSEQQQPGLETIAGPALIATIRASGAKATIVNAWASWCGPCRREVPMLEAMAANLEQRGVEVVLVSVDEPEDQPKAEAFLLDEHITLKSYLAARPLGPFKEALNPRWPGMLPATFLYDATGKLRYYWGGPAYENEILPIVEGFLAGKPIDGEANYGLAPGAVER